MTDIGASIRNLSGDHLRRLSVHILHKSMGNENAPVHKFVNNSHQEECSRMLKHLATFPNLKVLVMKGSLVVCPEFFRCIIKHTGIPFPSLGEFELQFAPKTADGRWFFQRDEEALEKSRNNREHKEEWRERRAMERAERRRHSTHYHRDDVRIFENAPHAEVFKNGPFATSIVLQDRFRSLPDPSTMLPFLQDASAATKHIPQLKRFILKLGGLLPRSSQLDYGWTVSRKFELWYLKAGTPRSPKQHSRFTDDDEPQITKDEAYLYQNRLYWRVGDWRPWDEVQVAWSDVVGSDAKIVFL